MDIVEIVMNPARQRIFQYLLVNETGTVKEMRKALPDIPSASLYRHVKILLDNGILTVVEENRIRGTVESVYKLNKKTLEQNDSTGLSVQASLLRLCGAFAKYFSEGDVNPVKDMLKLTDEEFAEFFSEINQVALKYMSMKPHEGSKTRQITLISSPVDGDET